MLLTWCHFLCVQLQALQSYILKVASEEPYMGEKIPLRWLKFEEAKSAEDNPLKNMDQVLQPLPR